MFAGKQVNYYDIEKDSHRESKHINKILQEKGEHLKFLNENSKKTTWTNEAYTPKLITAFKEGTVAKQLVNKNGGKIGVMFVINDDHKMKQFDSRKEAKAFQAQFNNYVSINDGRVKLPHTYGVKAKKSWDY